MKKSEEDGNFHNVMLLTVRLLVANFIKMNCDILFAIRSLSFTTLHARHTTKQKEKTFALLMIETL
jgi:hypothetical protein